MIREEIIYTRRISIVNEEPHYFVEFKDVHGDLIEIDLNEVCADIEIAKNVFYQAQEQLREDMRQYRSDNTHLEHAKLSIDEIDKRVLIKPPTTEETALLRELSDELAAAIGSLSDLRRRRFLMYFVEEKTLEEIADAEECSLQGVHSSIQRAQEELRNFLRNISDQG